MQTIQDRNKEIAATLEQEYQVKIDKVLEQESSVKQKRLDYYKAKAAYHRENTITKMQEQQEVQRRTLVSVAETTVATDIASLQEEMLLHVMQDVTKKFANLSLKEKQQIVLAMLQRIKASIAKNTGTTKTTDFKICIWKQAKAAGTSSTLDFLGVTAESSTMRFEENLEHFIEDQKELILKRMLEDIK